MQRDHWLMKGKYYVTLHLGVLGYCDYCRRARILCVGRDGDADCKNILFHIPGYFCDLVDFRAARSESLKFYAARRAGDLRAHLAAIE